MERSNGTFELMVLVVIVGASALLLALWLLGWV